MTLTEKKQQEVVNELKDWFNNPNAENFHFQEPNHQIEIILKEPKVQKAVIVDLKTLNNWYGNKFIYLVLTEKELSADAAFFASGYYLSVIAEIFAREYPANPPKLLFTDMALFLSNCLRAKWYDKSYEVINIINKGLSDKFLKGGLSSAKAAWFIVEIANKAFHITADYTGYNYPHTLGIYQQVLDKWNTTNLHEVDDMVTEMCEYHLSQANFNEDTSLEFSFVKEFVFTYEILAWLSVREKMDIKNPERFTHPLMQLPVNKLPVQAIPFHQLKKFDDILNKLKEEFPM
ncbi:hypothetical protein [Chitinophaga arvensicola]|uniref:Immunity protein 49 n=1 Tax=Chitinophaga arvensicola TaxID=29529 RepID=A0A1I0SD83_9BACT|nr:hypothetical protein [Chitinophaga arvensicola]SEW55824.1 hypothetical protein SAMN04488122_6488 [Chitinophaga arvensicola]